MLMRWTAALLSAAAANWAQSLALDMKKAGELWPIGPDPINMIQWAFLRASEARRVNKSCRLANTSTKAL